MIPVCEPLLAGNESKYVADAIDTAWISSMGKYVTAFEKSMAEYCGMKHGIAVCNGTVALHLSLVALGIGEGDEVIVPNFNGIYGVFAVCYVGAMPVFVDAEPETWNIDVQKIEEKITDKTKAIMPVHIYGHPCDMRPIWDLAKKYNLKVIEDAAEAHGAEYHYASDDGDVIQKTGSLGDVSVFSFFANKVVTSGEGGMVLTNDDAVADRCRYFKNLCFPLSDVRTFKHEDLGFNYKMSNVHAALGLAQVEKLDFYVDLRRDNHFLYEECLKDVQGIVLQPEEPWGKNVYWMNGVVLDSQKFGMNREQFTEVLRNKGIDFRFFFYPMHKQPSMRKYGCQCGGEYSVSNNLSENGLYLPSGSNLKEESIKFICQVIADASVQSKSRIQ